MKLPHLIPLLAAAFAASGAIRTGAAQSRVPDAALRAGASRVNYTPIGDRMPGNLKGVLDSIYVRSIVLDNGRTRAALVSIDAGGIPTVVYARVSARAAKELNVPATQLLLSAKHTHSVPFQLASDVDERIMQSLREAAAKLRPARMAWGTGRST